MINTIGSINSTSLVTAYENLEADIQWTDYGQKGRQTSLQYRLGEDPWTSSVGKNHGPETEYSYLNPFFKDTEFEEVIVKYNLLRSRLMWVHPFSCYSMHIDRTPRVHVPLITNPACYFVLNATKDPVIKHLPVNSVYWVDTRRLHTFINCSDQPRLHLVGVVIN
jgi:hypothetical protein